ncbi:MAG: NUDIX hydrolase [Gemmatimonadaceae bacterium]|nr:NUDIX hydrolase [Gemmatimonadaceae bacterium]
MSAPSPAPRRRAGAREEISAGGVVYRHSAEGPVVLLIRDGYRNWGFPKGHLEGDEGAESAARREVAEETGLREVVVEATLETIDWHFRARDAVVHKICHFFLMRADRGDAIPQIDEGITDCRWVSFDEARQLLGYANSRAVLDQARRAIADQA